MTDDKNNNQRFDGLDVLRAVAILLVLFSHGERYLPSGWSGAWDINYSTGFLGVEIFFTLSGFLIGDILLRLHNSYLQGDDKWRVAGLFVLRRWMRTLPLYFLLLGAVWLFPCLDKAERPAAALKFFWMGQNMVSSIPGNWLGLTWSLTIEEWSYLILPLLVFGVFAQHSMAVLKAAFMLILAAFAYRILVTNPLYPWDEFVRKTVATRFDALAYGVIAACAYRYYGKAKDGLSYLRKDLRMLTPFFVAFAALAFIFCSMRSMDPQYLQSSWGRWFLLPLSGFGLAGIVLVSLEWNVPSCLIKPLRYVARISYALYICHWPFMALPDLPVMGGALAYWGGTFALATLLSYGVEQPIMRLRPGQSPKTL